MQLIKGTFSNEDAQLLLTEMVKTKIAFHERKIRTVHLEEEDIKHSEKKIIRLNENLRDLISAIKANPGSRVNIDADINLSIEAA